jgi:hypothetical protein
MPLPGNRFDGDRRRLGLMLLLLATLIVCCYCERLRLGPDLPLRTVAGTVLLGCLALQAQAEGRRLLPRGFPRTILLVWAVLVAWVILSHVGQGLSVPTASREVLGRHLPSLSIFLTILYCARGRPDVRFVAVATVTLVCISSFVGLMQWLEEDWAWRLQATMNPPVQNIDVAEAGDRQVSARLVAGLNSQPYVTSYYLAAAGPMLLAFVLRSGHPYIASAQLVLVLAALVVLQERSAVVAFVACGLVLGLATLFSGPRTRRRGILLAGVLIAGGAGISWWTAAKLETGVRYRLDKFTNFYDSTRVATANKSLDVGADHILVGVSELEFREMAGPTLASHPHNVLLNAMVYHGLPGLILAGALLLLFVQAIMAAGWSGWHYGDATCTGAALALLGYLINAQFHNPSYISGDYLGWSLVALVLASLERLKALAASLSQGVVDGIETAG